jgi:hypothetical protein
MVTAHHEINNKINSAFVFERFHAPKFCGATPDIIPSFIPSVAVHQDFAMVRESDPQKRRRIIRLQ